MNLLPPKVIKKKTCLLTRGLWKYFESNKHPNIWKKEEWKNKIRDFIKVKKGGMHRKRYNGDCTKQWIRISKTIWTSLNLWKMFKCWTSYNMTSLTKDDVNDEMPNRTSKF
jgi:hypothetical protein